MNLNDDVVYRCLRLGPLRQLHPGRSGSLVRYHDRLHDNFLLGHLSLCYMLGEAGLVGSGIGGIGGRAAQEKNTRSCYSTFSSQGARPVRRI